MQSVMEGTSTALTSSANPSGPGQSVTFTATITPAAPSSAYPTGTVTFSDGSTVLGTGVVFYPGRALYSTNALSLGSHSITAAYSGDSLFLPSTSPALDQVVTQSMSFYTIAPCRVADTRNPTGSLGGPALAAGKQRTFLLAGSCGIPSGARALSLNITVTSPTVMGDLRLFPGGSTAPVSTVINYRAGQTRANNAIAALGGGGSLNVLCDQTSGTVQLIIDVNGYFE
jgi:hypothetical protein